MKIFDLLCDKDHRFEGWFGSGEDYEDQLERSLIACPMCASTRITRLPAAAYVNTGKGRPDPQTLPAARQDQHVALNNQIMAKLVEYVVKNTEDVGPAFPEEARKIHYKEAPERHIRGSASSREVAELREEGIDVAVLPVAVPREGDTH